MCRIICYGLSIPILNLINIFACRKISELQPFHRFPERLSNQQVVGVILKKNVMAKKFFIFISVMAVLGMSSCTTTLNSSKTKDFSSSAITATFADLVVSPQKITYTYRPTDDVCRGGQTNVVNTAIRKALEVNGGGDVLVELQTTIKKSGRKSISEVTVSGYPATYRNFRCADDETLRESFKQRLE